MLDKREILCYGEDMRVGKTKKHKAIIGRKPRGIYSLLSPSGYF
jgi:hypothetical protein